MAPQRGSAVDAAKINRAPPRARSTACPSAQQVGIRVGQLHQRLDLCLGASQFDRRQIHVEQQSRRSPGDRPKTPPTYAPIVDDQQQLVVAFTGTVAAEVAEFEPQHDVVDCASAASSPSNLGTLPSVWKVSQAIPAGSVIQYLFERA